MRSRIFGFLCAIVSLLTSGNGRAETIDILAAASTTDVVTALAAALGRDHSVSLRPTFAASSTLAKHIAAGAPAHLFLSANVDWMSYLEERGLIPGNGQVNLLGNRMVLLRRDRDGDDLDNLRDLPTALGTQFLIMGDPEHVPAGRYGRQALRHLKLWSRLKKRAVYGASVRNALALLVRGQGRYAIAYASDGQMYGDLQQAATFPEASHAPIKYPLALIRENETPLARKVFRYLQGRAAKTIFEQYGFTFLPKPR
ncbi:MAG: molybdate ABC transporter substrate-binding protein [Alphaproteobacteria bacterium]|nr:molybdate ABC transporter substrate-binding protein [Alphaproteobacteria bacterium]MDP7230422.1 molybdate ABC transporter substrate-binding protein [Alphaproteobacteria bacterium]